MGLQFWAVACVIGFYILAIAEYTTPTPDKGPECFIEDDKTIDTCPPAQQPCTNAEEINACRCDTDDAPGNASYSCYCGKPVGNTGDLNPKCNITGGISIDTCPPAQQGCPNKGDINACRCTEENDCVCKCGPPLSDDAYNIGS